MATIVSGKASDKDWEMAKQLLMMWRDNDAKLQPTLQNSDITAELIPVSQTLAKVSEIGLRAIDDLQNHRAPEPSATQSDTETLKAAEKPQAVLRNMVVAPVEMLVQAAAGQK